MLEGRCQCGEVRYEIAAMPIDIYVCHCTECRHQSSSAFGISVIVRADAMRIICGQTQTWSRTTVGGGQIDCSFCRTCGSRISHANPTENTLSIKGGSLSIPVDLSDATHIWTRSKLPGVPIPDHCRRFDQEPT